MENASKALLISAEILIAMAVITVGIYLYTIFNNISSSYNEEVKAKKVLEFNEKFLKLQGRKDITAQEIVSLINFVKQKKEEVGIDIKIYINTTEMNEYSQDQLKEYLKTSLAAGDIIERIPSYEVFSIETNQEGIVNQIKFKKIIKYNKYGIPLY